MSSLDRRSSTRSRGSDLSAFAEMAGRIATLAAEVGVRIRPISGPSLPFFSALTPEKRQEALRSLETYLEICEAAITAGDSLDDNPRVTWHALKRLGLRPPSDLFTHISPGQVIEVHTFDGIQVYRNLEFYKFISYSLEEIYCCAWFEMFHHDGLANAIRDEFAKMAKGLTRTTVAFNVPEHVIEEVWAPGRKRIMAVILHGAPLFDRDGRPAASLVIEKGEQLPSRRQAAPILGLVPSIDLGGDRT